MRVFVFSYAAHAGGTEALHQLADSGARQGFECYLYYHDQRPQVIPQFEGYRNLKIVERIGEEEDCVVVLPEVCTDLIPKFRCPRVVFWWLSVHNNHGRFRDFSNPRIWHAYQSEYARLHLKAHGVMDCHPLYDYINDDYRHETAAAGEKLNLIVFNPQKGFEITCRIVRRLCHVYGFAPLAGLNRQQVAELLARSKLYIDFGHHPGKDRIPREAALMGNCIVVGARGAARNAIDVPIPARYKIGVRDRRSVFGLRPAPKYDLKATCAVIDELMKDYQGHVREFQPYIAQIRQEKDEFDCQVAELFNRLAAGIRSREA